MIRGSRRVPVMLFWGVFVFAGHRVALTSDFAPSAISILKSGDLMILESGRGVSRYRPGHDNVPPEKVPLVKGFGVGNDLTVAPIGGQEAVFVTAFSPAVCRIIWYDLAGKSRREWKVPPWKGQCSGVAVDPKTSMGYVASVGSGEILRFSLSPSGTPVPWAKVFDAKALGAMVLDADHERLLVADVAKGTVIGVELASGHSSILVKHLGEPSALALDTSAGRLFITDAAGRRIWSWDLSATTTEPTLFVRSNQFRELVGLALAADGNLWAADSSAKTLFKISAEGEIVTVARP